MGKLSGGDGGAGGSKTSKGGEKTTQTGGKKVANEEENPPANTGGGKELSAVEQANKEFLGALNDAIGAVNNSAGAVELYLTTNAPKAIKYMNLYAKQTSVLTSKVAGFAQSAGTMTLGLNVAVDLTMGVFGLQSPGKTAANVTVGLGAARIGGGWGLAIGVGYFGLDKLGAFDGGSNYRPNNSNIAVQDATRVSFPIYRPR